MLQLRMKKTAIIFVMAVGFFNQTHAQKKYLYQDAKAPVEDRVKDLLSRMTLEEKVRQMDMYRGDFFKEKEDFAKGKSAEKIGKLGIGAIHDLYPRSAKMINDLQTNVIKGNRWGIPALIMCEMLHGYLDDGSTAFPMNIGLGATWDTALMDKVGKVIGAEARAHGVHFGFERGNQHFLIQRPQTQAVIFMQRGSGLCRVRRRAAQYTLLENLACIDG
mgnify:CR=1 FL=1